MKKENVEKVKLKKQVKQVWRANPKMKNAEVANVVMVKRQKILQLQKM